MYQNGEIWHENYKDERELEKAKAITSDCAKVTLYVYGGVMPKGIESDSNRVIESYIEFAKIYCADRKTRYVPCDNIDDFHTYNLYFLNFDYLDIFNIFFVNRDGQPVQIDRLLRNNDKRFKKHFSIPHNISKMARAGYFDTLESPEPEEELPPKEEPEQPDTPVDPDNPSTSDNVILSENTILLTDSIDKYVTNPVTGTTLNLDASIDEAELPEVGQVLLYGNVSEKFPLGFLGKVKDVVKSSSGYEVITEPVSLEEAFDKLYINETIALTSDEESQQNSRSTEFRLSSWHPQGYTGLECRWHTDFPIVPNVEGGWKVGSTSISGSLSGSVDGGFAMGANLLCLIDIDKKASKESYIKIAMGLRTSFGNKINLKGELTEEYTKELKKFKLAKPFMLSLQGAAIHIILHPAIVLSAFMKYEGKMELDFSQYADYEWEAVYLYEHGIGGLSVNKKDDKDNRTTVNKFSVDGLIDIGLSADFSMAFFNNENVACNFKIAAGPSLAAKLSYDGVGGNLYEKLKDNKIFITACKIKVNGGVQIDVFKKDDGEANMGVAFFNFEKLLGKREYYLFPEFKEKNALWKSNNQILAEYDVSRDLLFPVQLGIPHLAAFYGQS